MVSEETGGISVAERGQLNRMENVDHLRTFLAERLLSEEAPGGRLTAQRGFSDEATAKEPSVDRPRGDAAEEAKAGG